MYMGGVGAHFAMTVPVEATDRYTVEFWFRPDIAKGPELGRAQEVTYLFTMHDSPEEAMAIFVDETGQLKCAPLGRNGGAVLTYDGIYPLAVDAW